MPYTNAQIANLLRNNILPADNGLTLSQQVTEATLRRKLYAWEDKAVSGLNNGFKAFWRNIVTANAVAVDRIGLTGSLSTLTGGTVWRNGLLPLVNREADTLYRLALGNLDNAATIAYYAGYVGKAWAFAATTRPDIPHMQPRLPARSLVLDRIRREWEVRNGDTLENSLYIPVSDFQRKARGQLTTAISQPKGKQETPAQAIQRLKPLVGYPDKALYFYTQLTTRTAIMMAANLGALQFALEASNQPVEVVGGVGAVMLYLTAGDGKVCPQCQPYAGRMWRVDTINGLIGAGLTMQSPPLHYGCRCTLVLIPLPEFLLPPDVPPGLTWAEYLLLEGLTDVFSAFDNRATMNTSQVRELNY